MPIHLIRYAVAALLASSLCFAKQAVSEKAASAGSAAIEIKQNCISMIKRPDKEMQNRLGETMRDLYVAQLSQLDSSVLDDETVDFFSDLINKDENDWVRLEAVGTIANLPVSAVKVPIVMGLLEKYRTDQRVNFQVLASQSLLRLGRKQGTSNLQAEKTLAKIAQGNDFEKWSVMIPPHNVGTKVTDPVSKSQVPFEVFFKTSLRVKAIHALALSKDDFSRKVISELTGDSNELIRKTAKAFSNAR